MIHIDINDKGLNVSMLIKTHKLTSWDYANSQTEYELQKVRQARLQLQKVTEEIKRRKLLQQRSTLRSGFVPQSNSNSKAKHKSKDDGLEP